jgi:hypothetical protein
MAVGVSRPHTNSDEWQSFEARMRRRRVERCLLRADVALDAGVLDDVRVAIEEARQLIPEDPRIPELAARLAAAENPRQPGDTRPVLQPLAIAATLVILAGATGWFWMRSDAESPIQPTVERSVALHQAVAASPRPASPADSVRVTTTSIVVPNVMASASDPTPRNAVLPTAGTSGTPVDADADSAFAGPARPEPLAVPAARVTPLTDLDEPPGAALPAAPPAPPTTIPPAVPLVSAPANRASTPLRVNPESAGNVSASDERLVRAALERYEAAYSALNVAAASAVYPTVNRRDLARAFDGLSAQRVTLEDCSVMLSASSTARAECGGTARWTPKVGSSGSKTRRWQFDLRKADAEWVIVRADVR